MSPVERALRTLGRPQVAIPVLVVAVALAGLGWLVRRARRRV